MKVKRVTLNILPILALLVITPISVPRAESVLDKFSNFISDKIASIREDPQVQDLEKKVSGFLSDAISSMKGDGQLGVFLYENRTPYGSTLEYRIQCLADTMTINTCSANRGNVRSPAPYPVKMKYGELFTVFSGVPYDSPLAQIACETSMGKVEITLNK